MNRSKILKCKINQVQKKASSCQCLIHWHNVDIRILKKPNATGYFQCHLIPNDNIFPFQFSFVFMSTRKTLQIMWRGSGFFSLLPSWIPPFLFSTAICIPLGIIYFSFSLFGTIFFCALFWTFLTIWNLVLTKTD